MDKVSPAQYFQFQRSYYWNEIDTTPFPLIIGSGNAVVGNDVRLGGSNPQWRSQILAHSDASTYYSLKRFDLNPPRIDSVRRRRIDEVYGYEYSSVAFQKMEGISESLIQPYRFNSDTDDRAVAAIKRKIAGLTSGAKAMVPLGEIRELRGLIRNAAALSANVAQQLIALKKGKFNRKHATRAAQEIWLTYSFGVSPMMADISSVSSSIYSYLERSDHTDRVTGTASNDGLMSYESTALSGDYFGFLKYNLQGSYELRYRYAAGWLFNLRSSNDYTALQHFGLSPPNIIPTLWELVPYSWLVDYFTTAGAFLEDTFVGTAGSSIYITRSRRLVAEGYASVSLPPATRVESLVNRTRDGSFRYVEYERTPLASLPARVLRFKTLDEIGINGVNRLLNLASLLRF